MSVDAADNFRDFANETLLSLLVHAEYDLLKQKITIVQLDKYFLNIKFDLFLRGSLIFPLLLDQLGRFFFQHHHFSYKIILIDDNITDNFNRFCSERNNINNVILSKSSIQLGHRDNERLAMCCLF